MVNVGIALTKYGKDNILMLLQIVNQVQTVGTPYENRGDDAGKEHHVSGRQNGRFFRRLNLEKIIHITFIVNNHLECIVLFFVHLLRILLCFFERQSYCKV